MAFTDAVIAGGDAAAEARDSLADQLGMDAVVDAAAVAANFFMMTRIADATGTPLGDGLADASAELRAGLGVDDFTSKRI